MRRQVDFLAALNQTTLELLGRRNVTEKKAEIERLSDRRQDICAPVQRQEYALEPKQGGDVARGATQQLLVGFDRRLLTLGIRAQQIETAGEVV